MNNLDFELQKSPKKKKTTVFSQYFMMRHKRLACFVKRGQHILDANALMDGPWFVGTNIYMCKPGRRIFIRILPKCQPLRAINLPIEYYHPDFLKHVGHKLGKLLKVDAITSAAIRG